ncbi:uncharacterized protein Dvar_64440 [Desulfosarcina variabilis str. Montpellier]
MWRDSVTIRRRFCPLHPLDDCRYAPAIKRMVIRSLMAWCEAPRHRNNRREFYPSSRHTIEKRKDAFHSKADLNSKSMYRAAG